MWVSLSSSSQWVAGAVEAAAAGLGSVIIGWEQTLSAYPALPCNGRCLLGVAEVDLSTFQAELSMRRERSRQRQVRRCLLSGVDSANPAHM